MTTPRFKAREKATTRGNRHCPVPLNSQGTPQKISQYYGENVFNVTTIKGLSTHQKEELLEVANLAKPLTREVAELIAGAVTEWALSKGVTHFCHWFQPLTGATAEKHDSFLSFADNRPIEKLSASALIQGEPDASSFPNGGTRSTFEARGYTSWDMSSPMFIMEGANGKTLFIPTAFVSYHGEALDIKTPLLRSISSLSKEAKKFLEITGSKNVKFVQSNCGAEQEYFLIDKAFYNLRQDLVMTTRTVLGALTSRNQQLEDHYFGTIPDRVLAYMQEVEIELYRIGIPAKTRHNEVAPGQFELAPIFKESNVAADHNQLVMATLKSVAEKHDFMVLLHEKPFAGVNGTGKHLNWSMSDDLGNNLLEPGKNPHENYRFMAVVAIVMEAVYRHANVLRAGIASHGNDHRLGANEAPPSIISIFLGDTLTKIMESVASGNAYQPNSQAFLDMGATQLAYLLKDNTDRNRTSPFAFTGNKFEFRACGGSAAIGFPLSILNACVTDIFMETNAFLEKEIAAGKSIDVALVEVTKKWYNNSSKIIFNGDGYGEAWVKEAASRGLGNFRTTPEALAALKDEKQVAFLNTTGVFKGTEIRTRYNVLLERYIKHRDIEFNTMISMIEQSVMPVVFNYKTELCELMKKQKDLGLTSTVEADVYNNLDSLASQLHTAVATLKKDVKNIHHGDEEKNAMTIAQTLMPLSVQIAGLSNKIEEIIPDHLWTLPKYYDMLFLR
ncbi:MAG: glutamine synthetase III [Bacteriovoracaceae bacterium]